jgi:hypothetical protein
MGPQFELDECLTDLHSEKPGATRMDRPRCRHLTCTLLTAIQVGLDSVSTLMLTS